MTLHLRLLWVWLSSLLKPHFGMRDVLELKLRVLPNDLDINVHLSNARYLSMVDLALMAILVRSRFMGAVRALGAFPMAGGTLITYRNQIGPFERFRLRMWYLGCDDVWHVFGFAFVREDGRLAAKGLIKGGAVKRGVGLVKSQDIWDSYRRRTGEPEQPPHLPIHARHWLAAERGLMEDMEVPDPKDAASGAPANLPAAD